MHNLLHEILLKEDERKKPHFRAAQKKTREGRFRRLFAIGGKKDSQQKERKNEREW